VRDMTELMTSLCARLYGRRSAARRAAKAIEAVTVDAGLTWGRALWFGTERNVGPLLAAAADDLGIAVPTVT
jgi:hypothetical protein